MKCRICETREATQSPPPTGPMAKILRRFVIPTCLPCRVRALAKEVNRQPSPDPPAPATPENPDDRKPT